uniref:Uncharacterized protein n=1 Tax=Rhizophora mucronata TaxID=61149 RepID=A0A2P2QJY4_RHIMU
MHIKINSDQPMKSPKMQILQLDEKLNEIDKRIAH